LLNKIISYDSYFIEKNNDGIFKIIGKQGAEELIVKPIFEEIENEIVKQISSAKYTIWIAVAWITSLPIGREIVKKHRQGVNVRIVVMMMMYLKGVRLISAKLVLKIIKFLQIMIIIKI
jgi:phosphatidylserine/phosphatidylglycerophosphate/cardiolipin synthase-like enzyme